MTHPPRANSMTLIAVVSDAVPRPERIEAFATVLAGLTVDFDIVLVANGLSADLARNLKTVVDTVPDAAAIVLRTAVHDDLARLVGIEHAVGDWVLFCDFSLDDPAVLPILVAPIHRGYDLVVGELPDSPLDRPSGRDFLLATYARVYAATSGMTLERRPTGLRLLSRAAALFIAGQPNGELLVRARDLGPGFPSIQVPLGVAAVSAARNSALSHNWQTSVGMLLNVSSVPLRSASYLALASGVASVLYSLYVFAVFLFKTDVAAGWTTLSLQVSGMMLVFSIVLFFIGEYVLHIHSASAPRSREHLVLREIRSRSTRRGQRLNIVDADHRLELGRPAWLGELLSPARSA